MIGPTSSDIAVEVDRLVIAVHRAVMAHHRGRLVELADSIDVACPGHLYELAEFLAAGNCTVDVARRRFRYDPADQVGPLLAGLVQRGLIDGQRRPADTLLKITNTVLGWRADASAELWGADVDRARHGAAQALAIAHGPLTSPFRLLPEPSGAAHCLHHRLTGLRYARLDAHIAAWEDVGLNPSEIVALSAAVETEGHSVLAPSALIRRGWLDADGSATEEGRAARTAVEARTNANAEAMFGGTVDWQHWLDELRTLPPR